MTLKELNIGESAVIETVGGQGALRQHFLDMGLIPGEKVTLVKFAPMGDPMELQIHGYALTLRLDDAAQINVSPAKTVRVVPAACPEQSTPAWARAAATTPKREKIRCRTARPSPLHWRATRTAERPPCSTSLPAPTSM